MRREEAEKLAEDLRNMTDEEWDAVEHVREVGTRHSYTSCPPGTRAMCSHEEAHRSALTKIGR